MEPPFSLDNHAAPIPSSVHPALAHRPLITGMGAVSPLGIGVPAFSRGLSAGLSGIRLLQPPDPRLRSSVAANCPDFQTAQAAAAVGPADVDRLPRLVPMAVAAAREALTAANVVVSPEIARSIGVILGTGGGGIDFTLDQADAVHHDRRASVWTITNATHGNLAGELSIRLGCKGPSLCVSTGCASSSDALGLAMELLSSDRADAPSMWVVVGADAHIRWETLSGMELMRVISLRACTTDAEAAAASRPFDSTRDGYVLAEGAWAVVIERPSSAKARRVQPLARVMGYGATCDAYHRVRPSPDMAETVRAMQSAVAHAGWSTSDVQAVAYHGTATALNDASETAAVKFAFGPHASNLVGSSIKSMIGHPQGASGLASVVGMIACMNPGPGVQAVIPPTINLHEPDPACDLDYTPNVSRPTNATRLLVNCLAFGAKNSALAFEITPRT